jgi:hypothetical protein
MWERGDRIVSTVQSCFGSTLLLIDARFRYSNFRQYLASVTVIHLSGSVMRRMRRRRRRSTSSAAADIQNIQKTFPLTLDKKRDRKNFKLFHLTTMTT